MTGEVEIHGVNVEDGELGTEEDAQQFFATEMSVLPFRVFFFPACHVLVASKNDEGRMFIDGKAVVTHFAHESGVAVINVARDDTEVTGVIVEGVAVDMVDDLFFLAVRHFVVICSHNEQGYGYMPGATVDLKFQMVVLIEISVDLGSFFVREKIDACFATLCIEDGYLLIFDADVEDAPADECRVDVVVAFGHEPKA